MAGRWLAAAALLLITAGGVAARPNNETKYTPVEDLYCPPGQSSFGLSLGTPSGGDWADYPGAGAPFSVCLFCSGTNDQGFLQETCSYFEDAKRSTLVQKFECVRGEFLRGFNNTRPGSPESRLSCRAVAGTGEAMDRLLEGPRRDSPYRVAFPPSRPSNRVARSNWGRWAVDLACPGGGEEYICGVRVLRRASGRVPTGDPEPPRLDPMCCRVGRRRGNDSLVAFVPPAAALEAVGAGGSDTGLVCGLASLAVVLAALLGACAVNVWCCRFLPEGCGNADGGSYSSSHQQGTPGSTFNTRPNTVLKKRASVSVAPADGEGDANGNGGAAHRPTTAKRPATSGFKRTASNGGEA